MEETQTREVQVGSNKINQTIYYDPLKVGSRGLPNKEDIVPYLTEMIQPQTIGFDQVNMDMSFTFLKEMELRVVDNINLLINILHLWNLRESEYLFRGDLAAYLNSRRSREAKSMSLINSAATENRHVFVDEGQAKKGFSFWPGRNKAEVKP